MRTSICWVAALLGAVGIAGEALAAEDKVEPAPFNPQVQQDPAKMERSIGVCHPLSNPPGSSIPGAATSAENSLSPVLGVKNYFHIVENRTVGGPSTVTVLENPKHGRLEDQGTFVTRHGVQIETGERNYRYIPDAGFLGKDSAVLQVEIGGYKVRMTFSLKVETVVTDYHEFCPEPYWRISTLDANGKFKGTRMN